MAPSYPMSTTRVVTSLLLIFNIASIVALPSQFSNRLDTQNTLDTRAPAPGAENGHDVAITLNDKKEGKEFFKELGEFLSGFDPIDVFRTILGGLLGFEEAADPDPTTVASPSPTTTVTVAPTPVEVVSSASEASVIAPSSTPVIIPSSALVSSSGSIKTVSITKKTTVTKKVTATESSTKKAATSSRVVPAELVSDLGEVFSVLPFFPPTEPFNLTGLAPIVVPTLSSVIISKTSLVKEAVTSIPITISVPIEELVSISSIEPAVEPNSVNFTWPQPTVILLETTEASATPVILPDVEEVETPSTSIIVENFASLLPVFLTGQSDNVLSPTPIEEIEPSETVEVVTTPVAPVPSETEIFSILPFIEPGENISDNVTWPTPTEVEISVPELPIPVVTAPAEPIDAFEISIVSSTPESTEVSIPLNTGAADLDSLPIPLLEFVNGTYVLPTKKPHFDTPVLSPPNWNFTLKPTITQPHVPPTIIRPSLLNFKNSTKPSKKTSKKKPRFTKGPRYTKPILLPPPLVRPTNFPLNQTFFANQTKGTKASIVIPTTPLILTNSLRPTIRPRPLPKPFFNNTREISPIFVKPTRPLILTNPLRPTVAALEPLDVNETTTKTIKSRSTKQVTILVIPTPVVPQPDVSIVGVDIPADEPLTSGTGFLEPGAFPIIDVGVVSSVVDVVEPTAASPPGLVNTSLNATIPTPSLIEIDVPVANVSLDPIILDIPTPIPDIVSVSVGVGIAVNTPSIALSTLDIDIPLSTPTPTPRTFPTPSSGFTTKPLPALPTGFPLPTPIIDTNITFSPSSKRLSEYCSDPKIKSVTLPLLQKWYGPNAYPSLQSYPGCVPANPRQALQAPGLLNCTALGKEVQACQEAGKRVLLGVKVDGPSAVNGNLKYGAPPNLLGLRLPLALPPGPFLGRPGHPLVPLAGNLTTIVLNGKTVAAPNLFDTIHSPASLAATLFSLFGEGHAERADLRPLGPDTPSAASPDSIRWIVKPLGEEVVVDGFDVRTPGQWKGTPQADLVSDFVGFLREKTQSAWKESGGKKGGPNDLGIDGPGVVVSGYI
ncbi:hypothetical protein GRF29_164g861238 [Pseudopithomyces chartarum]|uniref:Uncharacterized protein n=1 Tax=Pseudopithomyces chartarum TaxID=1892770 RepID=A0AAN6LNX8_9PLEO|nr:hypothetical protein GRF29_164g861238 [Pseudopithomyces chartarum]